MESIERRDMMMYAIIYLFENIFFVMEDIDSFLFVLMKIVQVSPASFLVNLANFDFQRFLFSIDHIFFE
jgi:hypothetical protein